jgi:hypothetical protein
MTDHGADLTISDRDPAHCADDDCADDARRDLNSSRTIVGARLVCLPGRRRRW